MALLLTFLLLTSCEIAMRYTPNSALEQTIKEKIKENTGIEFEIDAPETDIYIKIPKQES